jgi:hypothetical protein
MSSFIYTSMVKELLRHEIGNTILEVASMIGFIISSVMIVVSLAMCAGKRGKFSVKENTYDAWVVFLQVSTNICIEIKRITNYARDCIGGCIGSPIEKVKRSRL